VKKSAQYNLWVAYATRIDIMFVGFTFYKLLLVNI